MPPPTYEEEGEDEIFTSNDKTGWAFFFQAEDGIRDKLVTGVQTCALPIYDRAGDGGRDDDRDARQARCTLWRTGACGLSSSGPHEGPEGRAQCFCFASACSRSLVSVMRDVDRKSVV